MERMVFESDGEVEICVRLQTPETLSSDSSYTLFTQDGTAIGKIVQSPTLDCSQLQFFCQRFAWIL